MSTIFKKIIDREIPANIVFEDDLCLAFHDVDPKAPVHVLLIPKEPIESLNAVDPGHALLMGHLISKVPEIAKLLGIETSGYRLVCNNGAHGGQSVFHIHFHILGGRPLQWPPG